MTAKGLINEQTVIRRFIDKPSIKDLKCRYTTKIQVANQTILHSQPTPNLPLGTTESEENPDSPDPVNSSAAESAEGSDELEDSIESENGKDSEDSSRTIISPGGRTVGTNDTEEGSWEEGDTRNSLSAFITPEPLLTPRASTFISQQIDRTPRHSSPIDNARMGTSEQGLNQSNRALSPIQPRVPMESERDEYEIPDTNSSDGSYSPSDDGLSQLNRNLMTEKSHKYEETKQRKTPPVTRSQVKPNNPKNQ